MWHIDRKTRALAFLLAAATRVARRGSRRKQEGGLTLVEMVLAVAIVVIVFAVVVPQFRAIFGSWDSKEANAEVLQNGRILTDHLYRNLSKAAQVTNVSGPTETNGYIEFQDNDGDTVRYDINSTSNYVEFGLAPNLADLAGPVSTFQFTCYDACDLDTPITTVQDIRTVKVQVTLVNVGPGNNRTFTTQAYIRTNIVESGWTLSKMDSSEIEFDPKKCVSPALWQIDGTHYICAYQGDGDDGWAVVLTVNTGNWTITKQTPFEFDAQKGKTPALCQIDAMHYLCAYTGDGDDGWAVVLTVNTGDWTIAKQTPFEFDPQKGKTPALCQIDPTHYLCAYTGDGDDGWAVVLTVNTGNWTISYAQAVEFDQNKGLESALEKIDDTHYLCAYRGPDDDGWAVVLEVDPYNGWDVDALTPFEFDARKCLGPALCQIDPMDPRHYLCAYQGDGDDGWAVVLDVQNFGNWAITTEASFEFDPSNGRTPALVQMKDSEHFLCVYSASGDDGWGLVLNVTQPPWSITGGSSVEFDPSKAADAAVWKIDDAHYLCVYRADQDAGHAVILWTGADVLP